ncbi:MAG TPA: response regulator [Verrucomicrobiae bacterium]|nr:response regulator [Verrucomicrobiae bacterium]
MSFKILFADDSMTAQNMATKILVGAGYEVVTVSNGAAAIKKIAEQRPDIVILDVYMPVYSGLEVCEKMRASLDTLSTPVLLTVGKMEHYRPDDATRVKADGIIIKPFEASDLLAIVKKLEERLAPAPPPLAEQTLYLERPEMLLDQLSAPPSPTETAHPAFRPTRTGSVEVPDHMTESAAFGDWMSPEQERSEPVPPPLAPEPAISAQEQPAPDREPETSGISASWGGSYERKMSEATGSGTPLPPSFPEAPATPLDREVPVSLPDKPGTHSAPEERAVPPRTETYPVAASEQVSASPTAAAESTTTSTSRDPELIVPAPAEAPTGVDPELITDTTELASFTTKFGVNNPEDVPVGIYAEEDWRDAPTAQSETLAPESREATDPSLTTGYEVAPVEPESAVAPEDDFEARVAAAMAAYDQPHTAGQQSPQAGLGAYEKYEPATQITSPDAAETRGRTGVREQFVPVQVGEPANFDSPAPEIAHRTEPAAPASHQNEPKDEPSVAAAEPTSQESVVQTAVESLPRSMAVELPAVTAAAAAVTGADPDMIAQVVHRAMERLKPQLIEEIVRELKAMKPSGE